MHLEVVGFEDDITNELELAIEHIEGDHGDTVLFIGRHGFSPSLPEAEDAYLRRIEPTGLTMAVSVGGDTQDRHVSFPQEITSLPELQGQLLGLLAGARGTQPDYELTSIEAELQKRDTLQTYVGQVKKAHRLTPNIVELTIAGFGNMPALGGDECFYLMVPRPEAPEVIAPGFVMGDIEALPEDQKPLGAYYTTRRRRIDEIDFWVVLHGHPGGVSAWAETVEPGDWCAVWGPRGGYSPPENTRSHLLVCDESGVPAVSAIIDQQPAGHPITVIAEAIDEAHRSPIPEPEGTSITWVYRGDAEAGTANLLLDAVTSLGLADADTDGLYAFGAGESRELSAIRRHLRSEVGMAQPNVFMSGYWRRDRSASSQD